jgi:hypothetical protein
MSRTFEVTLSGRGSRTAFIVVGRVLRIVEPVDTYERDVRATIIQDDGPVNVQESVRETARRYEAAARIEGDGK